MPRESRGLVAVEGMLAALRGAYDGDAPRFWGGLLGVWGHDIVRCFESLGPRPDGPAPTVADLELIATDTLLVFDNFSQRVRVCATARPGVAGDGEDEARARIDAVIAALGAAPSGLAPRPYQPRPRAVDPEVEHPRYREAVARAREHIMAGDIFQVVLAQPFRRPVAGLDPLAAYRMLRVDNPAPYMYLLELPSGQLAGASPEVLVRVDGGPSRTVTVRPLAGTRRRGATPEEDAALERELLADPKERAEHLMLIDLGRNDVGRVAQTGSVRVTEQFVIERYSHVMHIVSSVEGKLKPELDALAVLRATFPAGTVSGAPKVRAMEIIDELEPVKRGIYAGAVGYLGFHGDMDLAIAIRTAVVKDGHIHVQAGAGIVADSDPASEWQETQSKALAQLRAAEMAESGLDTRLE